MFETGKAGTGRTSDLGVGVGVGVKRNVVVKEKDVPFVISKEHHQR